MMTRHDIDNAQQAWGDGIVAIAKAHSDGGDYEAVARNHVETLYAYGMGDVLFKPTLAAVEQFRPTFDEALSYFVASNNACPEDKGFAIKGWTNVRFENAGVILRETTALAMGNYFFTTPEGDEVKVEYTFGYMLDEMGALRINVHHSSMPATV
ncbi:MAG: phosphoribosyl-AMP cyclohydrolase [Euryarchaeota archaeon]|nr:phosphoribosyl-AMP cyclohydrolase [Euryarchaeota archaeon]|tara:strand:+ start:1893 stop:2354 length:462 start_codon:yes stop_codon:yes gene_type:complete